MEKNKKTRLKDRMSTSVRGAFKPSRMETKAELVRYKEGVDRLFLILVLTLLAIGSVMVFSSSYAIALNEYGNSYYYIIKQLQMAAFGIIAMILMSIFAEYRLLQKITPIFFLGTLTLNYLTPFLGKVSHGTPRWFRLLGIQFQPSELLKLAVVLFFSLYIVKAGEKMKTFKWGILVPVGMVGVVAGALFMQSHNSGMIIIAAIALCLVFLGEAPFQWFVIAMVIIVAIIAFLLLFGGYTNDRIESWLNPMSDPQDKTYQISQSLMAIGSGGLLGVGIGESRQKYLYLPEAQNDFIFAITCEEIGFIGAIIVIALFVLLIWRGFVIAFHAPDKFSSFVVMGITIKVAIQTLLNIGVVTNAIPNTGISLPFFSYGGTALIVLLAEMGVVLSISRYSLQRKG